MRSAYAIVLVLAACGSSKNPATDGGGGGDDGGSGSGTDGPTETHTIGGNVSGLTATGLVLANGADTLPIAADGAFTFATPVATGADYAVSIATQPSPQICSVAHGAGTIAHAEISDVAVTCSTNAYAIEVTTSGLGGGAGVTLANGADQLAIAANGTQMFASQVADGGGYAVTIAVPPDPSAHLACQLGGPTSGTIAGADVALTLACISTAGPAMRVIVANALAANGATITGANVAPGHVATVAVTIQNVGSAPLHVTGAMTASGALAMRDQPATVVAPGDATVATLVATAPASGTESGGFAFASDDPVAPSFAATLHQPVLSSTAPVIYALDNQKLFAASLAGVSTQLSPASGGSLYTPGFVHRGTHAIFRGTWTGATDLYEIGLAPNSAPLVNVTTALTGTTGIASDMVYSGTTGYFTVAPMISNSTTEMYSIDLSTDPPGAPHSVFGPPTAGSKGYGVPVVSPFGDRIAFLADRDTANLYELYVADLPGGTPVKVNLPFVGSVPQINGVVWGADDQHLAYLVRTQPCAAPQFDLFFVDLVNHATTQANAPITGCHPPVAGVSSNNQPGTFAFTSAGNRLIYRSAQGLANGGLYDLYVTTNTPAGVTTFGVSGATVPGVVGVTDFATDPTGTRILFTVDTTSNGPKELYYTTLAADGAPTTTRVLQVASPSTQGVNLLGTRTFVTATRAIFTLDDQVAGQSRLFVVDLSGGSFSPVVVPGQGAFPASGTGLTALTTRALATPTPDGTAIIFATDQGTATASRLALYSSPLGTPAPTLLGGAGFDLSLVAAPVGTSVTFAQAAAASAKPITVWRNTIGHAGETAVSGAEITATSVATKLESYSAARAFYFAGDPTTGVFSLYVSDAGTVTPLSGPSTASGALVVKTNADP